MTEVSTPGIQAPLHAQLLEHTPGLRSLARALVGGEEAEDLVQDTMVAALSHAPPRDGLRPWLRTVLRNGARERARRERRRRARERGAGVGASAMPDPDRTVEDAEIVTALRNALDRLEEPYRTVLTERFIAGRSPFDIAAAAGSPAGTVRWRVHEGLRRMRSLLDQRAGGRRQWCSSVAALAWPSADPTGALKPMIKPTLLKALLAAAAIGGAATLAYAAFFHSSVSDAAAPQTGPMLSDASLAVAESGAALLAADALETTPGPAGENDDAAAQGCLGSDCGKEGGPRLGKGERSWLYGATEACADLLGDAQVEGRVEIDVTLVGGPPDVGTMVENVVVTRGREVPCFDGAEEVSAADAPNVKRLPELEACLAASLPTSDLPEVEEGKTVTMMSILTTDNEPRPPEETLPELDASTPDLDPQQAIAALALPRKGAADEPDVSVVECGDYDCPFCGRARPTVARVLEEYPTVAFHYLHNPLPMHRGAVLAARAAIAAQNQGQFWAMHAFLYDNPKARTEDALFAKAVELGLNLDRFTADYRSDATARRIAEQKRVCEASGARGTPSFFVGADLVVGAQPYEEIAKALDNALTGT